jgi:hypothetical protein
VSSAEVLATFVPQLMATTTAQAYPDPALRTLAAAHYRAFRNRRSLLLYLERQVRAEGLPWVRAVAAHRVSGTSPPPRCGNSAASPCRRSRPWSWRTRWSGSCPCWTERYRDY